MSLRAVLVAALALLASAMVMRSAFVDAYAARAPATAAALWPGHPTVILTSGLEDVGRLAAAGKSVGRATVEPLLAASAKAPLAPEPFLVRGVQAQTAGDEALATRAFLEARRRDPRSVAAHYFLAGHYLRAGQTRQGLGEIAALARLVPQALPAIAPQLAAYARTPGGAPQVKAMLRGYPELEPRLLEVLAGKADDSRLALFLWSGRGGAEARIWQPRLLNSLVDAGRYSEAHAAWLRFEPAPREQGGLIDPRFESRALAPFGWTLASDASGVAEPDAGGRLQILYYGRDDLILASQLLMLKPGRYQLSMRVSGSSPSASSLGWIVTCLPSSGQLASINLGKGGLLAGTFEVPAAGCPAQRLELAGRAPEIPEQAEATISELSLRQGVGR